MAEKRTNSEKKIDNEFFKIKIGTTTKDNPEVIYVEGRTFISPTEELEDYSHDMSEIKHAFKCAICNEINASPIYTSKIILDFQVATNGIKPSKKSFLSFQYILKQNKDNMLMKMNDIKEQSLPLVINSINVLTNAITKRGYLITKTKK